MQVGYVTQHSTQAMCVLKKMTFEEAKRQLEAEGYEYLGCRECSDCLIHYWCKPASEGGEFYVAIVDGWWGDHTPHICLWSATQLEQLKTTLM
jgi:hypothetical protein